TISYYDLHRPPTVMSWTTRWRMNATINSNIKPDNDGGPTPSITPHGSATDCFAPCDQHQEAFVTAPPISCSGLGGALRTDEGDSRDNTLFADKLDAMGLGDTSPESYLERGEAHFIRCNFGDDLGADDDDDHIETWCWSGVGMCAKRAANKIYNMFKAGWCYLAHDYTLDGQN
ncbi:unnamed protein product, partial [Sphacelaria rigidula]